MNKTILRIIALCLLTSIHIDAQTTYSLLSFKDNGVAAQNLGSIIHDGESYSTDIPNIQLDIFNANSETEATNRTATGSFGCYAPDATKNEDGTTFRENPIIISLDVATGNGSDNDNRPKYIVLASHDGSEFSFHSFWVWDELACEPIIKVEGFKDGISTGFVLLTRNLPNEWTKTFLPSDFPSDKFGNVDEVRISRGSNDQWIGNNIGINNFGIGTPVLPPTIDISKNTVSIAATPNSTATIDITANVSWTASCDATWLSISPIEGTGNGTITITAVNSDSKGRTATITISGKGQDVNVSKQVIVSQEKSVTTGLDLETSTKIHLYPNPASDRIYIANINVDEHTNISFEIINAYGKIIYSDKIIDRNYIDIQSLPKGLYILNLIQGDKTQIFKFIKN